MPEGLKFVKADAEYFLDCLKEQKPIESPDGQWRRYNMLALAGALRAVIFASGPVSHEGVDWTDVHPERKEAIYETFGDDLNAAIEFCSNLTLQVLHDEYPHDPETKAIVWVEDGERRIQQLEGFKE